MILNKIKRGYTLGFLCAAVWAIEFDYFKDENLDITFKAQTKQWRAY